MPNNLSFFNIIRLCIQFCIASSAVFLSGFVCYAVSNIKKVDLSVFVSSPNYIYDNQGKLMNQTDLVNKKYIPIYKIPTPVIKAVLSVEDRSFYTNYGINIKSIPRAILEYIPARLRGLRPRGSSTITQQLARQIFLNQSLSFVRKFKEFIYSFLISILWSKEKILELYINNAYFSGNIYGFHMAGKLFFGKSIDKLNIGEIAGLVGMLRSPVFLSPRNNLERFYLRRKVVLDAMYKCKVITLNEALYYNEYPVTVIEKKYGAIDALSNEVREFVRDLSKANKEKNRGGYKIYTSINSELQAISQQALREVCFLLERDQPWEGPVKHLAQYSKEDLIAIDNLCGSFYIPVYITSENFQYENEKFVGQLKKEDIIIYKEYFKDKKDHNYIGDVVILHKESGLMTNLPKITGQVTIMNRNGEIEATIGGVDFARNQYNIDIKAKRQIGSCVKIFDALCAIEYAKVLPSTVLKDKHAVVKNNKLEFIDAGKYRNLDENFNRDKYNETGIWVIHNWDFMFWGDLNLRIALEHSRNIPFVDLILNYVGLRKFRKFLVDIDMWPEKKKSIYPSAILGNINLSPREFARICCILLNFGHVIDKSILVKKITKKKECIFENTQSYSVKKAFSDESLYLLLSMMNGAVLRGNSWRLSTLGPEKANFLYTKTGTTTDNKDALCLCLIYDKLIFVSICKNDNTPLGKNVLGAKYPVFCVKKILERGAQFFNFKSILDLPKNFLKKKVQYNSFGLEKIGQLEIFELFEAAENNEIKGDDKPH